MQGLTTITFFEFEQNKPWAFTQMGLVPSKLQQNEGLYFFKLMGTGVEMDLVCGPTLVLMPFWGFGKTKNTRIFFWIRMKYFKITTGNQTSLEPLKCYPLKVMDCGVAKTLLRITLITSPIPISPWRLLQELL